VEAKNKNSQIFWYQLVFQCQVNPTLVDRIGPETLLPSENKQTTKINQNFDNLELVWIILGQDGDQFIKNDIIGYGLMMRISDVDPKTLTQVTYSKYNQEI
jgi:hypothetical protein